MNFMYTYFHAEWFAFSSALGGRLPSLSAATFILRANDGDPYGKIKCFSLSVEQTAMHLTLFSNLL